MSHLLFADNALCFCGASDEQLRHLRMVLLFFEVVSGLKVNLGKSEIIPIGHINNINDLAMNLNCKAGSFPITYLGLRLGAKFKEVKVWDLVLEKMERRLSGWIKGYLFKGGKPNLIRSSLASIPIYSMTIPSGLL